MSVERGTRPGAARRAEKRPPQARRADSRQNAITEPGESGPLDDREADGEAQDRADERRITIRAARAPLPLVTRRPCRLLGAAGRWRSGSM